MPENDELDDRLHALFDARAEQVRPQLDGPTLRARASSTARPAPWRAAPMLAAAAAVIVVAGGVTAITIATSGNPGHRPVEPGGGQPGSHSAPVAPSRPTPSAPVTHSASPSSIDVPPVASPTTPTIGGRTVPVQSTGIVLAPTLPSATTRGPSGRPLLTGTTPPG